MSFFLGIFPDENCKKPLEKVVKEVGMVFEGFEIPVRWSNPQNYHMTVIHLGENLSFFKKFLLKRKLKKLPLKKFKIKFNTVKLGISRKYKELIYLDLLEGGDEMRKLFLKLRAFLNIKYDRNFIPHFTLGRVSKELTDQEYSNICRDLSVVAKKLKISDIEFYVTEIKLVKSMEGGYQLLMNFTDFSSTEL